MKLSADDFRSRLATALPTASEVQLDQYAGFLALLAHWNRRIGLTAVNDPDEMVVRHVLDSLTAEPFLRGPRIIDVGTGPGLPGIPLAIRRPDLEFTLLDSLEKRMVFVRQAVFELKIPNVDVVTSRVEAYRPAAGFDTLVTRAFASLQDISQAAEGLCHGQIVAMKGRAAHDEVAEYLLTRSQLDDPSGNQSNSDSDSDLDSDLDELSENIGDVEAVTTHPVSVPGLDAERHIVVISRS